MMDCFAGEIIAVAMDDNMKKELCIRALKDAYELRKPADGLIHHSDAGSQSRNSVFAKISIVVEWAMAFLEKKSVF